MFSLRLLTLLAIQRISDFATFSVWHPRMIGGDTATVLDDKVKELNKTIEAKRASAQEQWKKFDEARVELAKSDVDITDESTDAFKNAHELHESYGKTADELVALEERRSQLWAMTTERGKSAPGTPAREVREQIKDLAASESYGQRVVAGEMYQEAVKSGIFNRNSGTRLGEVRFGEMMDRDEFHALITGASDTSGGAFVVAQNRGFVGAPDRPLRILDLITVGTTDSDAIEYVKETSFTNNAAEVAEATGDGTVGDGTGGTVTSVAGGVKPQSELVYEKVNEPVVNIAHWIATTRRALADAGQLRTMIDGRLRIGLLQRLGTQIVNGNGTGENILGLLSQSGVLSQAKGADSVIDAVHKAMTKVRLQYFEPNGVGIHPSDWEEVRLAKTSNGDYLYGPPALAGAMTAWGVPVASSAEFVEGNPLVGDFTQAELYIREGVQVLASDSHADFFIRNLIALLAEMRCALAVPMPQAFCEVTGA